ncbi:MAG TPA: tripartite tricarboxylate transporter substrate binding protein, partial [Methylomirabilota bacterium]|nr:tripartite tricarboxylate transporter substrate binding protein [Methylomirabilota bacterium]
ARKRPGEITFSSSGLYGASHVPFEMFLKAAGVRMRHLPTTGGAPMMNALLGGHVATTASTTVLVSPHVKADKLRLLAHTGAEPMKAFPGVPSLKSLGYDVEYTAWAGLVLPRGAPAHVVKILRDAMRRAVKEPEVVNAHAKLDSPVAYLDADEFNAFWDTDARKLAEVVKAIGKVESAQ